MTQYGRAFTRAGSIYAIGMAAIVPVGLISIALTTRYLSIAEYGRLAVLLAAASVLTVFSGIGVVQGALIAAYGVGEDDDVVEEPASPMAGTAETNWRRAIADDTFERQRLMGTGLLLTASMGAALCGVVAVFAAPVASLLLGSARWSDEVRWMSLSAWTGATWRMSHQAFRMERRAVAWSALQWLRPVLVLAGTIAALLRGTSVAGVLAATAGATLVSTLLALVLSRGLFRAHPSVQHLRSIWSAGAPYIPLTVAQVVQQQVSVLLLGVVATPATAGIFQVAQKIASIPTYLASGLLTAWAPLERSPVSAAARERKGVAEYNASIFTVFMLGNLVAVVMASLAAQVLILVIAPGFSPAVHLVPVLGLAYLLDFAFRGVYRSSGFPGRRWWFTVAHFVWLAPYAVVALVLVPSSPSYGVAIAQAAGGLVTTTLMVVLDHRGPAPRPYAWRRLAIATTVGAALVVSAQALRGSLGVRAGAAVIMALGFPVALRLTRAVSNHQLRVLRAVLAALLPRHYSRRELTARLHQMSPQERVVFVRLAWERSDAEQLASVLGVSTRVVLARFTRALRVFGGIPTTPTPVDDQIATYVAHQGTTLERDTIAYHLGRSGADLLDLDDLEAAMRDARRTRRRGVKAARRLSPAQG